MEPKRTGTIRCVDKLGRIVIPREMRKALQIHEGDPLAIEICGNSILLEKYQKIASLKQICSIYLQVFSSLCHCPCAVLSTDFVVASRGISLSEDYPLSAEVKEIIRSQKTYLQGESPSIDLFGTGKFPVYALFPIGVKSAPAGAVALFHSGSITPEQLVCGQMTAAILTELINTTRNGK